MPAISMSSAVFATTDRPLPNHSCIPAASFAPPVPPARTAQRSIPLTATAGLRPVVALGKARDPDAGVGLVAAVDPDQHRGEGLHDPGLVEWAGVDRPQPVDQLDQTGDPLLVRLSIAADQNVLVEGLVAREDRGAHRVERRDDRDALGCHLL